MCIIWRRWSDISPEFRRRGLFWFFQGLTAGYKLPGIVRQRVIQPYSLYRALAFVVFRILSVTCSLTRALFQSLAHAQQLVHARPNISAEGLHFSANPRRACAGGLRELGLSVCVSVTYHLTFPMFVCLTNYTTYLTGNEGQKFRAVLSENAPLQS